jgi:hypothetical protein
LTNQGQPQFRANNIYQYRPKPKAVPVYANREIVAERGSGKFSIVSVRLLAASADFPDVAINVQVQSGSGMAFISFRPAEFEAFGQTLIKWLSDIMPMIPPLEAQAVAIKATKVNFDAQLAAIKQIQNMTAAQTAPTYPVQPDDVPF